VLGEDGKSVRVFSRTVDGRKLEFLRRPDTNELVDAEQTNVPGFDPAYMRDQSPNITYPIESLAMSAI
jgi:hypothetical protein